MKRAARCPSKIVQDTHAGAPVAARIVTEYQARVRRRAFIILATVMVLLVLIAIGLGIGAVGDSVAGNLTSFGSALWTAITGGERSALNLAEQIIWDLRAPRVFTAVVAGAGLAVAGLIMQAILRNPLASPYTLGVASAASFGAALAIILQTSMLGILAVSVAFDLVIVANAFFFAFAAMIVVYTLARLQRVTPETIVLLGVAMMFLFGALTALAQYVGSPEEVAQLTYWMFGSLTKSSWTKLGVIAAVVVAAIIVSRCWAWDLNALLSGDDSARSVGIRVERIRLRGLLMASLVTAAVVAMLGPVAFIGLVAPHLARMLIGSDHRFLVPMTCVVGAVVLTAADLVSRTIISPVVIPVGIVTSFVGVPLLAYLVLRRKADHW